MNVLFIAAVLATIVRELARLLVNGMSKLVLWFAATTTHCIVTIYHTHMYVYLKIRTENILMYISLWSP